MPDIADVRSCLAGYGISVSEFDVGTPTSGTAAAAIGCTPGEIAKSILLLVGDRPVLVVTSGDMKVNSSLLKKATGFSGKVTLPDADQVRRQTGYAPGGVCPFLLPRQLPVFLDRSLRRHAVIYPAAGNARSAAAINYRLLLELTGGREVEVCTPLSPA